MNSRLAGPSPPLYPSHLTQKHKSIWKQSQVKYLHAPNKLSSYCFNESSALRWIYPRKNCNPSGMFTSSYKMQRTGVQNETPLSPTPPPQAGQPFNEWPLQLLAHHTYRLYSSCMCWNYKSLKSHFENTIKTFFSDCHNLPSHKNLRPMLQQQDVYCQLQTV